MRMNARAAGILGVVASSAGVALGQASPADESSVETARLALFQPGGNPGTRASDAARDTSTGTHLRTFELPAVTVEGEASSLREEDRVGSYRQPRWTASRRFPSTRVYVIPEGKVELEYWYRPTFNRDDKVETRMLGELEVGLPHRLQLDVYFRTDQADAGSHALYGEQIELRWALADWGEIWGNPTLYFEYINLEGRSDRIEPKLLLGGEIAKGWHWGVNFVAEMEINGPAFEHEYEFTSGVSYTVIDSTFSLGGEFKTSLIDEAGDRGHYTTPYQLGPTFQWKPAGPVTVNLETLVGVGGESPRGQVTLNVGFEF